ncbi:MAG: hypothetical protein J6S98_06240, partial [Lentisphaeria bacterium]|nr:hypothetical protein [Lentisphaeria bacterium]
MNLPPPEQAAEDSASFRRAVKPLRPPERSALHRSAAVRPVSGGGIFLSKSYFPACLFPKAVLYSDPLNYAVYSA